MSKTKIFSVVVFLAAMVAGPIFYSGYYSGGVLLLLQKPTLWVKVVAALAWIVADTRERKARLVDHKIRMQKNKGAKFAHLKGEE